MPERDFARLLDCLATLEGSEVTITVTGEPDALIVAFPARLGKLRIGEVEAGGQQHALASVPFLDAGPIASVNLNGAHLQSWEQLAGAGFLARFENGVVLQIEA
jgi:antitoxin (DNA-binding transcriptional repressor) of toxin-antitoxin stability system